MSADPKKNITFSVAISQPKYKELIARCIPDQKTAARFISSVTSAVSVNPSLQECIPSTIISGALLGESLCLSPSPQLGQYYLVPFTQKAKYDKQGKIISPEQKIAQFILGAKGYKQLAIRSNQYKNINSLSVREGEYKGRDKNSGDPVVEFGNDETLPVVGYYAFFELLSGFKKCIYWPKEKMIEHADKYSPSFSKEASEIKTKMGKVYRKVSFSDYEKGLFDPKDDWMYSSFWYKDFDSMAEKTMIRQLISQWGILSPEMQMAFESDGREIIEENGIFVPGEEGQAEEIIDDPKIIDVEVVEEEKVKLDEI